MKPAERDFANTDLVDVSFVVYSASGVGASAWLEHLIAARPHGRELLLCDEPLQAFLGQPGVLAGLTQSEKQRPLSGELLSGRSSKSLDNCGVLVSPLRKEVVCQRVAGKDTLRTPSARNSKRLWPTAKRAPANSIGRACDCSLRKGNATAKSLGS